jgi:hypothetical protein
MKYIYNIYYILYTKYYILYCMEQVPRHLRGPQAARQKGSPRWSKPTEKGAASITGNATVWLVTICTCTTRKSFATRFQNFSCSFWRSRSAADANSKAPVPTGAVVARGGEPSPGADVAGDVAAVTPGPGADVAEASAVPVQTWHR